MRQLTLQPEDIGSLEYKRLESVTDPADNPHFCMRWLFKTCLHNHECVKKGPCKDGTWREDEATGPICCKKNTEFLWHPILDIFYYSCVECGKIYYLPTGLKRVKHG